MEGREKEPVLGVSGVRERERRSLMDFERYRIPLEDRLGPDGASGSDMAHEALAARYGCSS